MRSNAKWCSASCAAKRPVAADVRRRSRLKAYGLSQEDYDRLLAEQDGKCAICRNDKINGFGSRLAVDHDAETGKVRGILCGNCNRGIGALKHDVKILRAAIEYLEKTA
jgi:Recombination endonuclease VII